MTVVLLIFTSLNYSPNVFKHKIYVTFSGDHMGLDQSREKLYCVRDNVQDFKGKAAFP